MTRADYPLLKPPCMQACCKRVMLITNASLHLWSECRYASFLSIFSVETSLALFYVSGPQLARLVKTKCRRAHNLNMSPTRTWPLMVGPSQIKAFREECSKRLYLILDHHTDVEVADVLRHPL